MTSTKNHSSAWPFVWKIQEYYGFPLKGPVTRKTFSCHEHCCFRITKVEYQLQTKRILYISRGLKYSLCNFIRCRWLSSGIKFTENETCHIWRTFMTGNCLEFQTLYPLIKFNRNGNLSNWLNLIILYFQFLFKWLNIILTHLQYPDICWHMPQITRMVTVMQNIPHFRLKISIMKYIWLHGFKLKINILFHIIYWSDHKIVVYMLCVLQRSYYFR